MRECFIGRLKPQRRKQKVANYEGTVCKDEKLGYCAGEKPKQNMALVMSRENREFCFFLFVLLETEVCFMGTEMPKGLIAELSSLLTQVQSTALKMGLSNTEIQIRK